MSITFDGLIAEVAELEAERDELRAEVARLKSGHAGTIDAWRKANLTLERQRDEFWAEVERLKAAVKDRERTAFNNVCWLNGEREANRTLRAEVAHLKTSLTKAQSERDACHEIINDQDVAFNAVVGERNHLRASLSEACDWANQLAAERDSAMARAERLKTRLKSAWRQRGNAREVLDVFIILDPDLL